MLSKTVGDLLDVFREFLEKRILVLTLIYLSIKQVTFSFSPSVFSAVKWDQRPSGSNKTVQVDTLHQ